MLEEQRTPHQDHAPLAGQHALVTGAGRGIGAAIADELARLGATVTLAGRRLDALEHTRARIEATHGRTAHAVALDVADPASVEAAFGLARERAGTIAILVNNAGVAESAPFTRTDLDLWQRTLAVNLTGAYLCTRQVIREMIAAQAGRVVTVASTAGLRGYPYSSAYVASKHGVIGLTRALALEVARSGVTVNAVCPGFVETEMTARSVANIVARTGRTEAEARGELERYNPQGRLVQPEEVARAVGWLCQPGSASITGQAIVVAGGEVM